MPSKKLVENSKNFLPPCPVTFSVFCPSASPALLNKL
jgi:hypothetical protein